MNLEKKNKLIAEYQQDIDDNLSMIKDFEQDIIDGYKSVFNVRDMSYLDRNPIAKIFYEFEEEDKTYFFLEDDYHFPSQSMIDTVISVANTYMTVIRNIRKAIEISKRKIKELEAAI